MGGSRGARRRCAVPPGRGYRTACRALPCSRCTPGSSGSGRRPSTTPRSCSCGGRGSACTSSPSATGASSPSGGSPTTWRVDGRRRTWPRACGGSSTAEACARATQGRRSACTPASSATPPTGNVVIRWDGARQPTLRSVAPPDLDPTDARAELARRYLHTFGPATPDGFGAWAGIRAPAATAAFEALAGSTTPVRTPLGDAWMLASDEAAFPLSRRGSIRPRRRAARRARRRGGAAPRGGPGTP
jgi:hypothetical protein